MHSCTVQYLVLPGSQYSTVACLQFHFMTNSLYIVGISEAMANDKNLQWKQKTEILPSGMC